ncbi:MAG: hypothetical protein ABSF50_02460 [Burkholderiaceae bacterium]|jgi:hypothetical protein
MYSFDALGSLRLYAAASVLATVSGCGTVVSAADTAGTIAVGAVGLAADAAVGAAKIAGRVVGRAADAVIDDGPGAAH